MRTRSCDGRPSDCLGASTSQRACNLDACKASWSCWTEWTPCSVSCGQGTRSRSRICSWDGVADAVDGCSGPSEMREYCNNPSCEPLEGWDSWSSWSLCDTDSIQYRRRRCLTNNPGPGLCQGRSQEERVCVTDTQRNAVDTLAVASVGGATPLNLIIGAAVGGCLVGALVACLGIALVQRKRKEASVPSDPPGYLSAKQQNHYVSMGSLDWKKSSTLVVDTALKVTNCDGHYPTATIKRNSHVTSGSRDLIQQQQQQQHLRANIEADNIF